MEGRVDNLTGLNLGCSLDKSCHGLQHLGVSGGVVGFCAGFVVPQTDGSHIDAAGAGECNFVLEPVLPALLSGFTRPSPVLSNLNRMVGSLPVYITGMGTNSTVLWIHRDPAQLSLFEQNGYELLTATNGNNGLRLFMSRPVDPIVLDYQLGLLDGRVVAAEIKKVKPQVPIVMLAEDLELPADALKSVDALVAKSDGPHFL
jgi:hypothetical protein